MNKHLVCKEVNKMISCGPQNEVSNEVKALENSP